MLAMSSKYTITKFDYQQSQTTETNDAACVLLLTSRGAQLMQSVRNLTQLFSSFQELEANYRLKKKFLENIGNLRSFHGTE